MAIKEMVGELSEQQMKDLLRTQQFARLACHANGRTYVVPISFAYDGTDLFGWTTPGKKVDMMRANPEVCIEVDDVKDLTDWQSVIVVGRFHALHGMDEARAMGLVIDKYGPVFAESETDARLGRQVTPARLDKEHLPPVVYRIEVLEMSGRFESPVKTA